MGENAAKKDCAGIKNKTVCKIYFTTGKTGGLASRIYSLEYRPLFYGRKSAEWNKIDGEMRKNRGKVAGM